MTNNEKIAEEIAKQIWSQCECEVTDGVLALITEALNAAQAEGYKLGAESKWLPIESAPKDGTCVLAPCGNGFMDVMTFCDGYWRETGNHMRAVNQPTHWQPLPPAPKGEE